MTSFMSNAPIFGDLENLLLHWPQVLAQHKQIVFTNGCFDILHAGHVTYLAEARALGRAGVHVLTPFRLEDGTWLLVNRGWLPIPPDRRSLPEVVTDNDSRVISGILNQPSTGGQRIGDADILVSDQWPQLVTYFELDSVSMALGIELEPWIVQLDAGDQTGFEGRQWKAAVMEPKMHGAYALQWFALAAAALVIWIVLGVRRAQALTEKTKQTMKTKK